MRKINIENYLVPLCRGTKSMPLSPPAPLVLALGIIMQGDVVKKYIKATHTKYIKRLFLHKPGTVE